MSLNMQSLDAVQNTEAPIYRWLFIALAGILLILMPVLSSDYGITGDEHFQRIYGDKLLKHKVTKGEDTGYLEYKNLRYYGGLFDYLTARLNPPADPKAPYMVDGNGQLRRDVEEPGFKAPQRRFGDVYAFRHLINALFGFIMMLFTGLLAKEMTHSWRVAFLTLLFLALSPRIFGHCMNNPKDIPFAAAFMFSMYYLFKVLSALPKLNYASLFCLALGIAAAINVRVGGLLLIAYFLMFLLVAHLWHPQLKASMKQGRYLLRLSAVTLCVVVLAYFGGQMFWPWARLAPLSNPFAALGLMENFDIIISVLFEGKSYYSDELPWYYIPKWLGISSPLFFLIGLLLALVLIFKTKGNMSVQNFSLLLFAAVFPIIYTIYKASPLYDGMRHFLFVYPVLVVVSAYGWHMLLGYFRENIIIVRSVSAVLIFLLFLPGVFMVKNHPYQYVYFNVFVGGVNGAYAHYETDYWMNSMKGLSDWFVGNVAEAKQGYEAVKSGRSSEEIRSQIPNLTIATDCSEPLKHYLQRKIPNLNVVHCSYEDRERINYDYAFWYTRYLNRPYLQNAWPPAGVIYAEKVDETALGVIVKRQGLHDYHGYQAFIGQDYVTAVQEYQNVVKNDTKNELAWLKLAEIYLAINDFQNSKKAIDNLMAIDSESPKHLFMQAKYFFALKDYEQAMTDFKRATYFDKKYFAAYLFMAQLESDPVQALKYVELYIEHGDQVDPVLEPGIVLAQKTSNQKALLYFEAEKALRAGDQRTAEIKMNHSLEIDPQYKPALKMKKGYDEYRASQLNN